MGSIRSIFLSLARLVAIVSLMAAVAVQGSAQTQTPKETRGTEASVESKLLSALHSVSKDALEAAQVARTRAHDVGVLRLAQTLLQDHGEAQRMLDVLMSARGVTLAEPAKVVAQREVDLDTLNDLTGGNFERSFTAMMVADHRRGLEVIKRGQQQTHDPEIQALLVDLQPVFERNLKTADDLMHNRGDRAPKRHTEPSKVLDARPADPKEVETSRGVNPQLWGVQKDAGTK
jgi:putative membrane protein